MKKKVLKICLSVWANESRDKRELSLLQELGTDIMVMAKGDKTGEIDMVDGFRVYRVSTRPVAFFPKFINRLATIFVWIHHAKKLKPNVISGHDLFALLIGYMAAATMKKNERPVLVYDSHEFEIGRAAQRNCTKIFFIKCLERFLINKCAFSIMVNDSIADEVQKIYMLKSRPIVARNTPIYWHIDKDEIEKTKKSILSELKVNSETFIVMYHGALFENRGIENLLEAIAQLQDVCAVILGNGENAYINDLKKICKNLNITRKVLFHKAVSHKELYKYVGAANVGTAMLLPVVDNHVFALPNKFFENIQSMTPVIVSDFPELGKLTEKYGIGIKIDPSDVNQIIAAIEKMRTDREFYKNCKENLRNAKKELCWENEKNGLEEAYKKILN